MSDNVEQIKRERQIKQNIFIITRATLNKTTNIISSMDNKDRIKQYFYSVIAILFSWIIVFPILIDIFLLLFIPGLHIFKPLFKAGWKYGLITCIGVTLAVTIISQYVFFIYSYQYQAFDLYMEEESRTFIQVEIENTMIRQQMSQYQLINRIGELALEKMNVTDRFLQQDLFFKRGTFTYSIDPSTGLYSLPNMPLIGSGGRLDSFIQNNIHIGKPATNLGEVVLLITSDFYNNSHIDVNSTISLYIPVSLSKEASLTMPNAQTNATVSGIVFIDDIEPYEILRAQKDIPLESLFELSASGVAYANWPIAANILGNIALTSSVSSLYLDMFYDVSLIDSFNIGDEIRLLKQITLELKDSFFTLGSYSQIEINSYLLYAIESFQEEYNLYQIFIYSFLAPIIILTIILTVYAANLVRKKRDRQLTILSERGTKKREIAAYLILEAFIFGFLSLIIGITLSIPLALLLSKSSGFMTFTLEIIQLQLNITSVIIALLGSIGTILLIQIFNILTLLKSREVEDYGQVEKKLPKYYHYFVDFMILSTGVIIWVLFKLPALSGFRATTSKYIGIPAAVLILFGVILVSQRLFPWFGKLLIKLTERLKSNIVTVGVKQVLRNQHSFSRSSIILCLSFSIVISSIIVPASYQKFNYDGAYYDLGADIVIRNFPQEDVYLRNQIENISGVSSTAYVRLVNLQDVSGDYSIMYSVLAINSSEYAQTAYFRDDFAAKSHKELIEKLTNETYVLAGESILNDLQRDVGDQISIKYRAYNESLRTSQGSPFYYAEIAVTVVDKFTYWPRLVKDETAGNIRSINYKLITNLEFMKQIEVYSFDVIDYLYIDVAEDSDIDNISDEITDIIGNKEIQNVNEQIFVKPNTARSSILYSAINSTLIMSFTINAIILALFASLQLLEKSREVATMKAIGITTNQLIRLFLAEYILLLIFSILVGLFGGLLTSRMFMIILTVNRTVPPFQMVYPFITVILVMVVLSISTMIGAIVPSIQHAKKEVGSELRQSG